jgi:hypothetical protein
VLGGCSDLCSYLPTQLEATVCNLLCDVVGIEAFIDLVTDADPDPIWLCEEVDVCPISDNVRPPPLCLVCSFLFLLTFR